MSARPADGPVAGPIAWLTGLPSSGKSTLAQAIAARLRDEGRAVVVLDGDEVRAALRPTPGYDDAGRDAFYESIARLAALVAREGSIVLVPATAHRRAFRDRARALAPGAFLEIFVDADLDTCRARDAKGLYARATAHDDARTLPGVGAGYETPETPDERVSTTSPGEVQGSVLRIAARLAAAARPLT